jgi:protein O-GlcNAc transferase
LVFRQSRIGMRTQTQILESAIQRQRAGDLGNAEALYGQILRTDPGHVQTLFQLGNLYQMQNRLKESITVLTRALQLRPDFAHAHNSLGVALARVGDYSAAADALEKAIGLRPDLIDLHLNLGNTRKSQENFDLAIQSYLAALRLNAGHAEARNLLGGVYAMQGNVP